MLTHSSCPQKISHRIFLTIFHKDDNIVILKPDKGNGVGGLDRTNYAKGILGIINDTHEFKELHNDPTIIIEDKLQHFL